VEASRQRLGLSTIPLLYLHGPRLHELNNKLIDLLCGLQTTGIVRRLGVNSFDTDVIERVAEFPEIDTVMLDYNILRVSRESLISRLSDCGKTVVAGSALANHLHAPHFAFPTNKADIWYLLRALKNYRTDYLHARKFAFLKNIDGWSPAQVAIAFVLSNCKISAAMFSTTSIDHLEQNISALGRELPESIQGKIRETCVQ
jgi:aryl-alcohol dehydrogenase-like predicted oxidoreductase